LTWGNPGGGGPPPIAFGADPGYYPSSPYSAPGGWPAPGGYPPAARPRQYHKRQLIIAVLATIGLILGIAAAVSPWYSTQVQGADSGASGESIDITTDLSPGGTWSANAVCSSGCGGVENIGLSCPYGGGGLDECPAMNGNGALYGDIQIMTVSGILAGALGAAMAFVASVGFLRPRGLLELAALLLLLGGALWMGGAAYLVVQQPAAFQSDLPTLGQDSVLFVYCEPATQGPNTTFIGSCHASETSGGESASLSSSWGPTYGWYVAIVGGALMVIAALALLSTSKTRFVRPRLSQAPAYGWGGYPGYGQGASPYGYPSYPPASPPYGGYPGYSAPGAAPGWPAPTPPAGPSGGFSGTMSGAGPSGPLPGVGTAVPEAGRCRVCGSPNAPNLHYCTSCGQPLA
jgi:hypothetical protein